MSAVFMPSTCQLPLLQVISRKQSINATGCLLWLLFIYSEITILALDEKLQVHGELAAVDPAAPIKEIRCCAWRTKNGSPWEIVLCIYDFPQHLHSPCTKQFQFNHVLQHLFFVHQKNCLFWVEHVRRRLSALAGPHDGGTGRHPPLPVYARNEQEIIFWGCSSRCL